MAQLSEHDRRVLLGDDYLRRERESETSPSGARTPEEKRRVISGQIDRNADRRPAAITIMIAGALIAILHLRQTFRFDLTTDLGLAGALLGLAWLVWLVMEKRRLVTQAQQVGALG